MIIKLQRFNTLLIISVLCTINTCFGQLDTLRILSYNVLYLGDNPPCQTSHSEMEGYLETVVAYVNPDITGFVKMEAVDASGSAPAHFADSALQYIFNAAYPGRYAYCSYTNHSAASNITMLFYDQQKLGFVNILCSYSYETDFDTYKLYYKTPNLATTHDSIFLYVTLNHTESGSGSSDAGIRATQISGEMAQIETHFSILPNMINMGDFNVHNSAEACYQTLVAPTNLNYRYYDPPFYPDALFSYPADWDNHPGEYSLCLTTSTRTGSSPNECSNDFGGGKSWYDHIFLSSSIINKADHISYQPNSFRVIGNDGSRVGVAVVDPPTNTSAPAAVVNSVYQISQHYPVVLDLLVDTSGVAAASIVNKSEKVVVVNPVGKQLEVMFGSDLIGKTVTMRCYDMLGRLQMNSSFVVTNEKMQIPCSLLPGTYGLAISANGQRVTNTIIAKE